MSRPILVLEHEAESPAGLLAAWLDARELPWEHRRLPDGSAADPSAYGAIVSLGSHRSVNDDEPWIADELAFVREALAAGIPVLGLCFGAQLLAKAAGGTVVRSPEEEFGWIEPAGPPGVITDGPWFCWHGDAFTLPPDAELLAASPVCPQAYRLGRSAGFQFHPEVDETTIDRWMRDRPHRGGPIDLAPTAARIPDLLPGLRGRAFALLDWWLDEVAGLARTAPSSAAAR